MDFDDELPGDSEEQGSDELLADDKLRLPESASNLVRLHAVRAWLARRRHETDVEIGEQALALQQTLQQGEQDPRPRRREQAARSSRLQQIQQALHDAQERMRAYEEAQALLDECVDHTTSGERVLVEYYLSLEEIVTRGLEQDASLRSPHLQALEDVLDRVEHVGSPGE